jgi:rhodanese-related sulfurtransferase
MMQRFRNLSATSLRTVENLLSNFDQRPVRMTRWILSHAADFFDPPRNMIPKQSPPPPAPEPESPRPTPPPAIDGSTLKQEFGGVLVLDVREPHETAGGIIPGAKLIPMRDVLSAIGELRDAQKPVVVYCAHGVRSANVATHLRDRGLDARTLTGGIGAWVSAGGELVQP